MNSKTPPDLTNGRQLSAAAIVEAIPPSGAASSAEHLDDALRAAESGASATGAAAEAPPVVEEKPAVMPRDEWCKMWLSAHGIAGFMLRSNALASAHQRPGAMDAAGAIYDTACEVPAMRWLVQPDNKWLQRMIVVGAFYGPLGREVVIDLRANRAKPAGSGRTAAAAAAPDAPPENPNPMWTEAIDR